MVFTSCFMTKFRFCILELIYRCYVHGQHHNSIVSIAFWPLSFDILLCASAPRTNVCCWRFRGGNPTIFSVCIVTCSPVWSFDWAWRHTRYHVPLKHRAQHEWVGIQHVYTTIRYGLTNKKHLIWASLIILLWNDPYLINLEHSLSWRI